MIRTHYCIQCIDRKSNVTGSFIVEPDSPPGAYRALSPVFSGVNQLFDWMHQNGWELEHTKEQPFGCVGVVAPAVLL